MVDDVPPYWIYLPRNLSYVGDQVWDYFVCCKRRNMSNMNSVVWHPGDVEEKIGSPENLNEVAEAIDGDPYERVEPSETDLEVCDGDSGLTNSVSDDSDITIPENRLDDFPPLLNIENEDAKSDTSSDAFTDDLNGAELENLTGVSEVAKLSDGAKTARGELARNLFKDQKDGGRLSFMDLLTLEEDTEDSPSPELRRSTSLKTTKTPPGTPRRKKAVRFADAFGLDLEHIRNVWNLDSPPRIPVSAIKDLRTGIEKEHIVEGNKYFNAMFPQPGADTIFIQRVLTHKVCLENAVINNVTITGTIRVANISFHKCVRVRYTMDDWKDYLDVNASYVMNSCDGATDRFSFTISITREMDVGERLQFAIYYDTAGQQYWDNNHGKNYVFECYAKAVPALSNDNAWLHFL